jgi:uncharacterized membrane protein
MKLSSLSSTPRSDFGEVIFQSVMYWRIAYGAIRVFIGYKLLSLIGEPAVSVYRHLFRRELTEDPHDQIFQFFAHSLTQHGYSITYFLAAYFLFWGTIDIVLSYTMIRHHLWAFLTSIYLIAAFIVYEIYRYSHTHSSLLLAFIVMDSFFMYLIWREYKKLLHHTLDTKKIVSD